MIHDPNVHARLLLLGDSSRKAIFCESDELFAEALGSTGFQGARQITPCQRIMARDRCAREFFDGARGESVSIEMDLGQMIWASDRPERKLQERSSRLARDRGENFLSASVMIGHALHSFPLRATSLPSTTPHATLICAGP